MTDETVTSRAHRRAASRAGRPVFSLDVGSRPPGVRWAMLCGAAFVTLLVAASVVEGIAAWGRIHPGVSVGGVAVGGMSRGDARTELQRALGPRLGGPVAVSYGPHVWTVDGPSAGASVPAARLAEAAFGVGRTGNVFRITGERLRAWFGGLSLPAAADADPSKLDSLITQFADAVYVAPRDAWVNVTASGLTRVSAKDGVRLDADRARADLLTALVSTDRHVLLAEKTAKVQVTDADADAAYADGRKMAAGGVTVSWQKEVWRIPAANVARWISFRKVPPGAPVTAAVDPVSVANSSVETSASSVRMVLQAFIDPVETSNTLMPLVGHLGKPAVDARFKTSGKTVSIVPSQVGLVVDVRGLSEQLDAVLRGAGPRAAPLQMTQRQPRLTTDIAKGMGILELISSYSTNYDPGNASRVNNIHTLARALDGRFVAPGATFSFNDTIGERTAAKGYQEAPAIVNGKLVPQLGGGICQMGTTFFNTVFFSGLAVVERTNHSFYISHYPTGRDCTVTWGGPDFRFRNDTKSWILIKTDYDSSSVTISLFGTNPHYTVQYTTGPFTSITPYPTVDENDPTLPVGAKVVKDSGVDGRSVVVVRTVFKGGAVVRRDTFTSVYKPKSELVRVGTKPPVVPLGKPPKAGQPPTSTKH